MTERKWLTKDGEKTKPTANPPPEGEGGAEDDKESKEPLKKRGLPTPKSSPRRLTRIELLALLCRETTEDVKGREAKGIYKGLLTKEFQ